MNLRIREGMLEIPDGRVWYRSAVMAACPCCAFTAARA
jgi:hypothetical protein